VAILLVFAGVQFSAFREGEFGADGEEDAGNSATGKLSDACGSSTFRMQMNGTPS